MLRKWRSKSPANKGEEWSPYKRAGCALSQRWATTLSNCFAALSRVQGSRARPEAEKGEGARTSETRRGGEPARMGGARGLEGRSSRGRRALCGAGAGVDISTWGEGSGAGGRSRAPSNLLSQEWRGARDAREGRPLRHHHEAGVGRRRGRGGGLLCSREGQEEKVGRPPGYRGVPRGR